MPRGSAEIILKKGRERSLEHRHPWVFSGAVERVRGTPANGATVDVVSCDGDWLARAAYSRESQITARVWSFDPEEEINIEFFAGRISSAVAARGNRLHEDGCTAMRLVHGESDGLPGVVADMYGKYIVLQLLTPGAAARKREICRSLSALFPDCSLYERSDSPAMEREKMPPTVGAISGDPPPAEVVVRWSGINFAVNIPEGQKTGAYLDQAEAIPIIRRIAGGAETVLDTFCYSGAFTVAALQGGAKSVMSVDSSELALATLRRNMALNGVDASRDEQVCADVFAHLRKLRDSRKTFDLIILDPPKFADTKTKAERASRAYKDINLLAMKLLNPGGHLATFSCSGAIDPDLFQKIVAGAALDSGRFVRMISRTSQAPDHPVSLAFPEGLYLKGLICDML